MREVRLYGQLGRRYGRMHRFRVGSPAEAMRALCANFPGFEAELSIAHTRGMRYAVWDGAENIGEDRLQMLGRAPIRIAPIVAGSKRAGVLQTILGVTLIAIGAVLTATGGGAGAAPYFYKIGAVLALGGVAQLLTPMPKSGDPNEDDANRPNNVFDGPVNTTAQGHPVPVGYGRLEIGSAVISAGIDVDDVQINNGGTAPDPASAPTLTASPNPASRTGRFGLAAIVQFTASAALSGSPFLGRGYAIFYVFEVTVGAQVIRSHQSTKRWSFSFRDPGTYTVTATVQYERSGMDPIVSAPGSVTVVVS